ncbi:MAG: hypothetical protein RIQ60_1859 [Pseudomonadota bacterium]
MTLNSSTNLSSGRGFAGIWPALLSPLDARGAVDGAHFAAHAAGLLAAGCGGVTPFGTTGEFASFSVAERRAGVEALLAGGVPADRVIVSTSAAALPDVIELTRHALDIGAHGVLMLPPFYFKGLTDAGVLACFRQVIDALGADAARLKLYLYHIPQLSTVGLSHDVIRQLLADCPGIVAGIKDSECRLEHSLGLAQAFMPGLDVYVGNELDLRSLGRLGSRGAISGLANFMPRSVHRLVTDPDGAGVQALHDRAAELLRRCAPYALIPALRGIQAAVSGDAGWLRTRAPLMALDAAGAAAMAALVNDLGIDAARD